MKKRSDNDISRINFKRSDKEHSEVFPSMFLDMKSLKLKRIPNWNGDRNNHKSNLINAKSYYLVGYNGTWHLCKARKAYQREDWEFDLKYYNIGLSHLDFVFEIVSDITDYDDKPLGRLRYNKEDEDY